MTPMLLVMLLAHGGYWFGERANPVELVWNQPGSPAVLVRWQVMLNATVVGAGQIEMAAGEPQRQVRLMLPNVRAPVELQLRYEVMQRGGGGAILQVGSAPIHAFPEDLLHQVAGRWRGRRIVLVDRQQGLSMLLKMGGMDHRRIDGFGEMPLQTPDLLVVGEGMLHGQGLTESEPQAWAREGAIVIVLAQQEETAGVPLVKAGVAERLLGEEPFSTILPARDLSAWIRQQEGNLRVMEARLEGAQSLLFGAPLAPGHQAANDALLMAVPVTGDRREGGWLVLCQIPGRAWSDDPRAALLMRSLLEYGDGLAEEKNAERSASAARQEP